MEWTGQKEFMEIAYAMTCVFGTFANGFPLPFIAMYS